MTALALPRGSVRTQAFGTTSGFISTTNGPMDPQEATGAIGGLRVGVGLGVTCVCRSGTPLATIGHHWTPSVTIS